MFCVDAGPLYQFGFFLTQRSDSSPQLRPFVMTEAVLHFER